MNPPTARKRKLLRLLLLVPGVLLALMLSGLLLTDWLTPAAVGAPSTTLPLQPGQTALDQQLAPLLEQHPGQTGVLYLADGLDAFAARATLTRQAGRSLDVQYYIWKDDMTGHLLGRELYAAAERGVRVRFLLDDLGSNGVDAKLLSLDSHPNIEIRLYNPFRNRSGLRRTLELVQRAFSMNHRMHNKTWVADGRVAIIGGRNIGEEYFSARDGVNFQDLDLLLTGHAVAKGNDIFDSYWNSEAVVPIAALGKKTQQQLQQYIARSEADAALGAAQPYLQRVQERLDDHYLNPTQLHWSRHVEIHSDPPLKHKDSDKQDWLVSELARKIGSAQHKALLISPYFVPGDAGTRGFSRLSARGVQVGVLTNSLASNDVAAVHSGYMHYRKPLLEAGVQLYEMKPFDKGEKSSLFGSSGASLHTKAFIIDDSRGFVGSFNLDPRSAYLNTEMGVLFDDPVLAMRLRQEYLRLVGPDMSYWVYLDSQQRVRWLDRAKQPATALEHEPDTSRWQRATARVISWLPIESQL
jgi:putative cardiolipin synthase